MLMNALFYSCFISPLFFGTIWLLDLKWSESIVQKIAKLNAGALFILQILIAVHFWDLGKVVFHYARFVQIEDYTLDLSFQIDSLSITFGLLTSLLYSVVLRYSVEYLSREPGFFRFFFLISSLSSALILIAYSANYDTLTAGWEVVGVCSVLLISFFHTHEIGARSSLYALVSYKFGDAALLTAIGLMHHQFHSTQFAMVHGGQSTSIVIPMLLIFACLPKSSQFPFSGWIKRAIEGPSVSTAIFYGALSIHLGAFLLLRMQPLWENLLIPRITIGLCGVITMLIGTSQARTRSDAKSVLVAASQAQVGIIFLEIALGFNHFALFHMVGHAGLRTWQLLRASSLMQDFQDNPAIFHLMSKKQSIANTRLYQVLFNGFYIESTLEWLLNEPIKRLHRLYDSVPRAIILSIFTAAFSLWAAHEKPEILWIGYLSIFWLSLRALASSSIRYTIFLIGISQFLQLWISLVCTRASASVILFSFLIEIPLVLALFYWVERIHQQIKLERNRSYLGIHSVRPELFPIFTLIALFLSGFPIGISFFSEDLAFHHTLNNSISATFLLILSLGINTTALFRVTYRMFWGLPEEGLQIKRLTFAEKWSVRGLVFLLAVTGVFPERTFQSIHALTTWARSSEGSLEK